MPEFVMDDLTSHKKIIVHFRNDADVQRFADLLGQRIVGKQKSLWFPEKKHARFADKRYVDES